MATGPVVDGDVLNAKDVPAVVREIFDVRNESEILGRVLKVPIATVESIHLQFSRPKDRLLHIIDEFVKQEEPSPTWRAIVDALRDPLINQPRLAQDIERRFCPLTSAATASSAPCGPDPVSISSQSQMSTSVLVPPNFGNDIIDKVKEDIKILENLFSQLRYDIIDKVKEEIKILENMFSQLRKTVLTLLEKKCIGVDIIVFNLTTMSASNMSQHEPYFEKNLDKLEKCREHRPLFSRLNLYWNYLSPQLLYHLVDIFLLITVAKEEMSLYDKRLTQFRCCTLLKLFCQIEEEDIEPPEGFSKIVAKFETPISERTTLQDVEKFRLRLARHYRLRDFALMLKPRVRPGSFVVSFVVPNSVLERLKTDIPPRHIFEMFDVTKLDVVECCVVSTKTDPGTPGESMKTSKVPGEVSTTLYAADFPGSSVVEHSSSEQNVALVDGIQLAQVIRELKDHIGINWKAVARELEFTTTDVDAIVCRDEHDLKEQIHRFFEQWKMREGSGASVQKLIEAVRAAGLRTILDDLQRALPELECGGIMPVQETAPTGGTPTSERDLVRMKRLQKMSISDDPSFQPSSSPGGPRRSASSQTAAKNSEPSPIKAGVSSSFEVGQVVKVDHKPKPWYGVIKYIGPVTDCPGTFAGVEMDEVVEGGHAGKFGGKRYFTCNDGYGLMLPRSRLNLDDRFDPPTLKGGSVGGDDVERDKNMPSTPTQPTASRKPSDPLSPDLMKGDAAKPTQKEMPGVFESTDSPETSGGGEVRLLAFECAGDVAGFVIGRDGKNRRDVESKTDTRIRVEKKEGDTAANTRVIIMGKKENCQKALLLIVQNLRRKTALHTATTETIDIPSQHCGRVIGRKGANVRAIENLTGTRINIEQPKGLDVFLNFEAVAKCKITGSAEQIEKAKEMVRKSVEGSDIAGAAFIAAFMLKFMKEIKAEGHTFE